MNPHSLLASAAINTGLAFTVLSLFSVLKKQPSTAPIYYARRLARRHYVHFDDSLTFCRFLPSVSWIPRAFRVTEDEILETSGLDALVIIRLFKFGIKFFVVCSLVGLVILIPVNYNGQDGSYQSYHSMDSFTISNISRGSNRLWVHFSCLWFISFYGLYLLHEEYNEILLKRIQQLQRLRHQPDQFTILVREIPFCTEHKAHGYCVDHFFSKHHPYTYHSYEMVHDGRDVEVLLGQAESIARKIEDLRERPMAMKTKREHSLLDAFGEDAVKISLEEDRLQVFCEKIRQLQHEIVIKQKENYVHGKFTPARVTWEL